LSLTTRDNIVLLEFKTFITYYQYTAHFQAVNRAGLAGAFISKRFVRDMSPPGGGHVLDGDWGNEVNCNLKTY